MFPLGSVLLPGSVLPLHIFESRYRQLIEDCLGSGTPEFGVVLIERGHEVGGGDFRAMLGTVARLVQVAKSPDGRYAVAAVGIRRIRVREWLDDNPYPLAEVEDWPDTVGTAEEGPQLSQHIATLSAKTRRLNAFAAELGDQAATDADDLDDDPVIASYQLCGRAPVGPSDLQRLLGANGPSERLTMLDAVTDDVLAMLQFRLLTLENDTDDGLNFDQT